MLFNVGNDKLRFGQFIYICLYYCSRSSMDRIMVSGTIDMSSNLVGSTKITALAYQKALNIIEPDEEDPYISICDSLICQLQVR